MNAWSSTAHDSEQNRARESVTACVGRYVARHQSHRRGRIPRSRHHHMSRSKGVVMGTILTVGHRFRGCQRTRFFSRKAGCSTAFQDTHARQHAMARAASEWSHTGHAGPVAATMSCWAGNP